MSLLFSDVEGSTLLLHRLGPSYVDALDAQRIVLRGAWAAHGGTELGTEGDSFFVVFPTAPAAVGAAAQAQRELAGYAWPGGEHVLVRMGIHTGSPMVHDGSYVGMDVHRAARVAGAAHGGQVLVSAATAGLLAESLPAGVGLRDLGLHRLKDITAAERLFQLTLDGLRIDFPPVRSLGAASSLPVPGTPLVGRDGELAELARVLGSSGVRLLTLTGPGGSGKTRLAVELARRLVAEFPDGVYFVPLVSVGTAEVMWTTVAEVLDVPPERRMPPALFSYVAHRGALLVLDNLEQLGGADAVIAQLLTEAPNVVLIATSRRPLHLGAEHEHAVPPLELPAESSLDSVGRSGAVRLFLQHANKVKAGLALTADNAADIVEICRRLDGLPLALELAAARMKLLSPPALLGRLDQVLDLKGAAADRPTRQRTLRETIGWSYELLAPQLQVFFRELGVFAGGADLGAVAAVTAAHRDYADPLDLVAELVDASLATISADADGQPRVGQLETIRAYARDQLSVNGEFDQVRHRHAQHYLGVAERLRALLDGEQHLAARAGFEAESQNLREALTSALQHEQATGLQVQTGLRIGAALSRFWLACGYYTEGIQWLQLAVDRATGNDDPELADCLDGLAKLLLFPGHIDRARDCAAAGADMCRRLNDDGRLQAALCTLASVEMERGNLTQARIVLAEVLAAARESGNTRQLLVAVRTYGDLEYLEGNFEASGALLSEGLDLGRQLGDPWLALVLENNLAWLLVELGRVQEAKDRLDRLIPDILRFNIPGFVVSAADSYGQVLARSNSPSIAVRVFGAVDAMRERAGISRSAADESSLLEDIARTRTVLSAEEWNDAYRAGRNTTVEAALKQAVSGAL